MLPTRKWSIHLFRLLGVDVFLHLSWFLLPLYAIVFHSRIQGSLASNALVYGALFLIVLMHEFGHALACRQVGGRPTKSFCGLWAGWPTCLHLNAPAPCSGALSPAPW